MRSRPRTLAALVAWACCFAPVTQRDAVALEPAEQTVALVIPEHAGELDERARATVGAHLQSQRARVVIERPARVDGGVFEASLRYASEHGAAFVLWVALEEPGPDADANDGGAFLLYVLEPGAQGLLGRRVAISRDASSAALENLANVASVVTASLLEGDVVGLVPAETLTPAQEEQPEVEGPAAPAPPEVAPEPAPPETRQPSAPERPVPKDDSEGDDDAPMRMGLSLGYTGNIFASGIGWQNAAALSLAWLPARGAFVSLGYDLVLPNSVDAPPASFVLRRHPVVLAGGYRFVITRGLDIELGARVTVDPIVRVSADDQVAPVAERRAVYVFSSVAPTVGVGYQFVPEVRLGLFVGVDAVLRRTQYSVQLPDRRAIVVNPYPIRVIAGARLDFSFLRARR